MGVLIEYVACKQFPGWYQEKANIPTINTNIMELTQPRNAIQEIRRTSKEVVVLQPKSTVNALQEVQNQYNKKGNSTSFTNVYLDKFFLLTSFSTKTKGACHLNLVPPKCNVFRLTEISG